MTQSISFKRKRTYDMKAVLNLDALIKLDEVCTEDIFTCLILKEYGACNTLGSTKNCLLLSLLLYLHELEGFEVPLVVVLRLLVLCQHVIQLALHVLEQLILPFFVIDANGFLQGFRFN
jgi:hypothetical protein